jgi:N,N-dimethylformamidase
MRSFFDLSSRRAHGTFYNQPARAVTGHLWNGQHRDPGVAPEHWGAVHFHSDDLSDAGWSTDLTLDVPPSLSSGIYAAQITQGSRREEIPFYVTSTPATRAEVLFLAPTNTYLAYANEHLAHGARGPAHESMMAEPISLSATDVYLGEHPELGLSLYDTHADGSGVMYSSRLRPILNMRAD